MGTKVEGKTYLPGYFGMADFSVNSNGNWFPYHEEKKPNGHLYDRFTIMPANGSADFDKEMLKRTMLVHEATFRKQVYELHRLYKIQKDLMAQFQREEFNGYSRPVDALPPSSFSSQAPSGDAKRIWQIGPPTSGHDNKQPSINFMKESRSEYSLNGAPLRHNDGRSMKKMLDLQLPADAYADNDDVQVLEEKPASLSRNNGSVLDGEVKLSLGNNKGSSCMVKKSWIADLQTQRTLTMNVLNKPVEESSDVKITDFLGVGASSQNHFNSSRGVNLNFIAVENNFKGKHTAEASGSNLFGANKETRNNNLFSNKEDDQNVNMAWFNHKQNGIDTSKGHYFSSYASLKSPWETSSNTIKSHGLTIEPSVTRNGFCNGFAMGSIRAQNPAHALKIPSDPQYPKHLQLNNFLKGVNLNIVPPDIVQDGTAIHNVAHGRDNSPVEIPWLTKKSSDFVKSQMPSGCANGQSHVMFGSTGCSEGGAPTRLLGFPIIDPAERSSQCPLVPQIDTNTALSAMHDTNLEMQVQQKKAGTNVRNLIDLNDALPYLDDLELDVYQSGGTFVSQQPDDSSNDSLAITAAENLVAISKDVFVIASEPDTLHWFAKLATSKENAVVYSTDGDDDDEFEVMTLQLEETKGYEYTSTPRIQEPAKKDEDHGSAASLLLTKPRRGQARRRRQKKDFQKDILPGLASLSRHEVSEDLQTLGRSMPVALTRRGGRSGSQSRGRRRATSTTFTMEEVQASPPPILPPLAPADLDADGRGIMGWGRTTRRCRRPRGLPVNNPSVRLD